MAMGHHFINNAIVNMLHVVSDNGADTFMVVRIAIAQSISFIIVWIWYVRSNRISQAIYEAENSPPPC